MKKIKFKNSILALALIPALALASLLSPANRASAMSRLSVSPMKQSIVLSPGSSYSGFIKVSNSSDADGDAELPYKVTTDSFYVDDEYRVKLGMHNEFTAMKDWITITQNEKGRLKNGESAEVGFTINVPEDAVAGGQYASIVVATDPDDGEGNVGIKEIFQFAATIYASVSGSATISGEIRNNSIPSISLAAPLETSFSVQNTGNVHSDVVSYLQVFPLFSDEEVYTTEENPNIVTVLPNTTRFVTNQWEEAPALGMFKVRQTIEAFGVPSVSEKVVLLCPLWFIVVILALLAACIFWLVSRGLHRKKK